MVGSRPPRRLVAAVLAAVTVLAGCSSSGSAKGGKDASTASSAPSSASVSAGPAADPATTQAVTAAFQTFFSNTSTAAQSQAALQHGDKFTKTLEEQGKSSYADKSSAKVTAVHTSSSPDVVSVAFTVSTGSLTLPFQGYAVRTAGTWQVAAKTFCDLLTLEGSAPAACQDQSITALPH